METQLFLKRELKVKTRAIILVFLASAWLIFLLNAGCEQNSASPVIPGEPDNELEKLVVFMQYSPAEIDVLPLTEFVNVGDTQQSQINLYVSLLDTFGSEIKSPCIFRFELYEKVQRSAEPKGRRIIIWPDIDLTGAVDNNRHWRNFLRAYEFNLPFGPATNHNCIIEVTCLCPTGKRLISDFTLNAPNTAGN